MPRTPDPGLRARLLEAAGAEFAEKGFAGATVAGVGARAGVTKGGVYFHFRTKEELFFAAVDRWREELRRSLDGGERGRAEGAEALRAFLRDYLELHFRRPVGSGLARVLAVEMQGRFTARLRQDTRGEQRWLRGRVRELLIRGGRDGGLFAEDPAFAAFLIVSAVGGVLEQWGTAAGDVEPFCDAEQLATALVAPYRTPRGRPAADDERIPSDYVQPG